MRSILIVPLVLSLLFATPGCALAQAHKDLAAAEVKYEKLKAEGADTTEAEATIASLKEDIEKLRADYVALGQQTGSALGGPAGGAAGGLGMFGLLKLVERFLANGKKKAT